ncbi:MAG: hypothetical protein K2K32_07555 [Muribaculaceae bacterium]|nr:hypothetical protein [Muribaculaceae bacterium]
MDYIFITHLHGDHIGGIISIPAYGHTPGHTVFRKDTILIAGDLMHGVALQTQYPEYCARYDMDKAAAIESRQLILRYAHDNSLTLLGMHFPPTPQ